MIQTDDPLELERQLVELLSDRDRGLLSQAEYDEKLEEIRGAWLSPEKVLYERELRDGGTRFILRNRSTGRCLQMFEFRRSYSSEV